MRQLMEGHPIPELSWIELVHPLDLKDVGAHIGDAVPYLAGGEHKFVLTEDLSR